MYVHEQIMKIRAKCHFLETPIVACVHKVSFKRLNQLVFEDSHGIEI